MCIASCYLSAGSGARVGIIGIPSFLSIPHASSSRGWRLRRGDGFCVGFRSRLKKTRRNRSRNGLDILLQRGAVRGDRRLIFFCAWHCVYFIFKSGTPKILETYTTVFYRYAFLSSSPPPPPSPPPPSPPLPPSPPPSPPPPTTVYTTTFEDRTFTTTVVKQDDGTFKESVSSGPLSALGLAPGGPTFPRISAVVAVVAVVALLASVAVRRARETNVDHRQEGEVLLNSNKYGAVNA